MNSKLRSNWKQFIRKETILPELRLWSITHTMPGLKGVPVFDVSRQLGRNLQITDIMMRASAISFNLLLALFPFTIFILTTLPYFPIDNAIGLFESYIHGLIPRNVERAMFHLINDTIRPRTGLLSIGFIAAVYFATNGMIALINAFDQVKWAERYRRNVLQQRGVALLLTGVLVLLLATAVVSLVLSNVILNIIDSYVTIDYLTKGFILSARWIPTVALVFIFIATIYHFAPSIKPRISFFSVGAVVATVLLILVSAVISYFVNNFSNYNKIYGSIGAIIAFMVWLHTNMLVILFGYELNLSVMAAYSKIKIESSDSPS